MLMARAGLRLLEGVESGGEERKEKEEKLAESNGVKIRDQRRRNGARLSQSSLDPPRML